MTSNTKQKLEAQAEELRNKLNELESTIKNMPERDDMNVGAWKPSHNELYWLVAEQGITKSTYWCGDSLDEDIRSIGNCFRTKEEAENEIARRKMHQKLKEMSSPVGDSSFSIAYSIEDGVQIEEKTNSLLHTYQEIRFGSEADIRRAITKFTEEEWKNYFYV